MFVCCLCRCLGMEETLLDLLDTPSSTVELTQQYRMNEEIMHLSNSLIYNNKLECGTELLRTETLQCGAATTDVMVSFIALTSQIDGSGI